MMTTSAFTFQQTFGCRVWTCSGGHNLRLRKSGTNEHHIILEKDQFLTFPVFPLRKSVLLPTETLKLNLYEPRYLAMSEHILEQDDPLFGALYASEKPQIVKGGKGPIIPMLDVGDIGVVCFVKDWEEGTVPTQDPSFTRRRIRLNALAVSRFRIEEIVCDGAASARLDDPSFILVRASIVTDERSSESPTLRNVETDLRGGIAAKINTAAVGQKSVEKLLAEVLSIVSFKGHNRIDQRHELFSFLAAGILAHETRWGKGLRKIVLELVSTDERFLTVSEWM
eukprot:scaffold4343_cov144-Cylindrotheca_fusiformis.AAC.27